MKFEKPVLLMVVDTEEEFDWSAPPSREATGVGAMRRLERGQRIADEYGIKPVYVADYPVVSQTDGWKPLYEFFQSGRCEIGTHVHPWVNPPFEEDLTPRNTYMGNLPAALEREKLRVTTAVIAERLGQPPKVYKAGRYGIGPNSAGILAELGYEVDLSTAPPFNYTADGGPDFSGHEPDCYWWTSEPEILEIPTTGAFVGRWQRNADRLYAWAASGWREAARMPGILSRLGVIDRLRLSPEQYSPAEHRKLTRFLIDRGVRVFTFSFHSTSLDPGRNDYVRTQSDLDRFLDSFRGYFDYFFGDLGGVTMTASEVRRQMKL